jgi:hypothetical protein
MRNLKLLSRQVLDMSKKAKMITILAGLVVGIIILDWLVLMDRTALAGFGGTLASVSGSLHEVVGLVAGAMTIIYMSVKIYQEVKKK